MKVLSWSRTGWERKSIPAIDKYFRLYECSDRNNNYGNDEFKFYNNISNKIETGEDRAAVDVLPAFLKEVYQSNDFYTSYRGIYKVIDPVNQVYEDGNWGTDSAEADKDIYEEITENNLLSKEKERIISTILSNYEQLIEEAGDNDPLREYLSSQCQSEIEKIQNEKYLEISLNTGHTGNGYNSPKAKVRIMTKPWENNYDEIQTRRENLFISLLNRASHCYTKQQIWGKPTEVDGKTVFVGGFMADIRDMYHEDKAIYNKWSDNEKEIAINKFIDEWRESFAKNPMHDEESLNKQIYIKFLREEEYVPPIVTKDDKGKKNIVKKMKYVKPSHWEINKRKALQDVYLTLHQWSIIYKMKDIMLKRIEMNTNIDENRDKVLNIIRRDFLSITTIAELKDHIEFVTSRKKIERKCIGERIYVENDKQRHRKIYIPSYDFELSLLDQISIEDEIRWRAACKKFGRKE
jgi:hypothetical protein